MLGCSECPVRPIAAADMTSAVISNTDDEQSTEEEPTNAARSGMCLIHTLPRFKVQKKF